MGNRDKEVRWGPENKSFPLKGGSVIRADGAFWIGNDMRNVLLWQKYGAISIRSKLFSQWVIGDASLCQHL